MGGVLTGMQHLAYLSISDIHCFTLLNDSAVKRDEGGGEFRSKVAGVKRYAQRGELKVGAVALTVVCHVEDDNDAMCAAVVGAGDCPEALLAGGVPDLHGT